MLTTSDLATMLRDLHRFVVAVEGSALSGQLQREQIVRKMFPADNPRRFNSVQRAGRFTIFEPTARRIIRFQELS